MQETVAQRRISSKLGTLTRFSYQDRGSKQKQRMMEFYAKEVERIDHSRRSSLEPNVVPGPTLETEIPRSGPEGED